MNREEFVMSNEQKPITPEMRQHINEVKQQFRDVVDNLNKAQRAVKCLLYEVLFEVWLEICDPPDGKR